MNRQKDLTVGMFLSIIFHALFFLYPASFFVKNVCCELYVFKKGISSLELTLIPYMDYHPYMEYKNVDDLSLANNNYEKNVISTNLSVKNNFDPLEKGVKTFSTENVNIYPHYPLGSRIRNEEGDVKLGVSIDKDGKVQNVKVLVSSGYRALDEAARNAFLATYFPPSSCNRSQELTFVVCFRLRDK